MIEMISRNHDVLTGKHDLEPLYTFHDFPVFMGCVDGGSAAQDITADMRWAISKGTGCIQLDSVLPLDVLYQASHGSGSVGTSWMEHHRIFAEFIHQFGPKVVFEIGGAHGVLPMAYAKLAPCSWTVIEPNPTPVAECPARFIKGFFGVAECDGIHEADAVVHSHVFEHIYEPEAFVRNLSNNIKDGGMLLFSVPDLQNWLINKYSSCLNFEHTIFLAEPFIDFLLNKYDFEILKKDYYNNGHSIFYAAKKRASCSKLPMDLGFLFYEKFKNMFLEYVSYNIDLVSCLNKKMFAHSGPIYLFGAHVFSLYLIAFGLKTDCVVSILDNDENKQGRRLYGTNLRVQSPRELGNVENTAVILRAGIYNEEIKKDILENINPSVVFWE